MDAGKIYNTWPLMGSTYFPDDNKLINLFNFNSFSEPSLVQFMHRNLAYLILFFYLYMLIKIQKLNLTKLYISIRLIGVILFFQIILGIFTLLYGAQILLASMHQISSIFLVSSSIFFLYINSNTS
jgi:cytochrome c oxidase assembly protein subunit 15